MPLSSDRVMLRLVPLFGISGIAALIYQICWQRLLYAAFGVDILSITIIVSAFMLGLGVGALAGGELADRHPRHILQMFAGAEFAIGLFGLLSPWLIATIAAWTMQGSPAVVAASNFLLLLVPTTLMGATLPMLVAHCLQAYRTVGGAIGTLYFINTLGAAGGAALTGFIGFHFLGLAAAIRVAVALNFIVGMGTLLLLRRKDG